MESLLWGSTGDGFYHGSFGKDNTIWVDGAFIATDGDLPNDSNHGEEGIAKFDSIGNLIWYKFYGSNSGDNDIDAFITTSDGGALFSVDFNYAGDDIPYKYGNDPFLNNTWLCKIDSNGAIQWGLVLGGTGGQYSTKIKELQAGKYTVLVNTSSTDSMLLGLNFNDSITSPWLVEVDTGGHILSSKVVQNIVTNSGQTYYDFTLTIDSGILLAGVLSGGLPDFALAMANSDYQLQWFKQFGGYQDNGIQEIASINDSIIVFGGSSRNTGDDMSRCDTFPFSYANYHVFIGAVNINTEQLVWQKALCGSGESQFEALYYDTASNALYVLVVSGSTDGDFAGIAVNDSGANYLLKYTMDTATGIGQINANSNSLVLYPNPATGYLIAKYQNYQPGMSLVVYNCLEQVVQRQPVNNTNQQIDVSHLAAGLYMVCVKQNSELVASGKFVKE